MINQAVEVRAKRILGRLGGYESVDDSARQPVAGVRLGKWIGRYSNPGGMDIVDVFEDGLAWDGDLTRSVRYDQISAVNVSDGIDSRAVILTKADGEAVRVTIAGGEGRIRDSMEFYRFVSRVIGWDIRNDSSRKQVVAMRP